MLLGGERTGFERTCGGQPYLQLHVMCGSARRLQKGFPIEILVLPRRRMLKKGDFFQFVSNLHILCFKDRFC
jgi:hypothetical protein